jgi:uroporphyrin-III C-methyltransferase/precorrin-2 dehydrogenase/sirohydrochlorin ferrochelatase
MRYFPLGFDLRAGACLLVGGGAQALAKARLLHKGGAQLMVVAPHIDAELRQLVLDGNGSCTERSYKKEDCENKLLVVVADTDEIMAEQVSAHARAANIPVNVVDQPQLSSVIFTALVEREPLWFAISSDGRLPILARHWRHRLESYIEPGWGAFALMLEGVKSRVLAATDNSSVGRRRLWERLLSSAAQSLALRGRKKEAQATLDRVLQKEQADAPVGEVWLVGAGPGNPDLLTLEAARLMEQADVVYYDRLVSAAVLERVRRDAERISVGKSAGCRSITQDEINAMLLKKAQAGQRVLRLKGGDPFVFARGGEELEYLANHNVPFKVVPGITAANGCACYAGIPLTDRRLAHSVRFLSGHTRDGALRLPLTELVDATQTLVFYMGTQRLPELMDGLLKAGRDANTPVAIVEQGTMAQQRVLVSSLSALPAEVKKAKLSAPTLLIVGEVVRLHNALHWYEGET